MNLFRMRQLRSPFFESIPAKPDALEQPVVYQNLEKLFPVVLRLHQSNGFGYFADTSLQCSDKVFLLSSYNNALAALFYIANS